jgi:hypothetical protein
MSAAGDRHRPGVHRAGVARRGQCALDGPLAEPCAFGQEVGAEAKATLLIKLPGNECHQQQRSCTQAALSVRGGEA